MASFYGSGLRRRGNWAISPAARLREAAEQELKISIFFVDVAAGISGAACHLDDGNVIVINRNEALGRLNFDIGHEIFHLLTWERMPPDPMDISMRSAFAALCGEVG